jgi:hypothetical protein
MHVLACCALTALLPVRTVRAGESASMDIPTAEPSAQRHSLRLHAHPGISTFGDRSL